MKNFLVNRAFQVKTGRQKSDILLAENGLPQGSSTKPMIFPSVRIKRSKQFYMQMTVSSGPLLLILKVLVNNVFSFKKSELHGPKHYQNI